MKLSKANQVATFEKLLVYCRALDASYNPGRESIQPEALDALLDRAKAALKTFDLLHTAYENALNVRKPLARSLHQLASRVTDALVASGAPGEVIEEIQALRNRYNGPVRKKAAQNTNEGAAVTVRYRRTLSQLDLATKMENFDRIVHRVSVEPRYNPNERDLKVTALRQFSADLFAANQEVVTTLSEMKKANATLNDLLYGNGGIFETAKTVKTYIRSVFGKRSPQSKDLARFRFIKR